MTFSKRICLIYIITLVFSAKVFSSICIQNQYQRENSNSELGPDYKKWALQKICFDKFKKPKKISTEDDQLHYNFYEVKSIRYSSNGPGSKVTTIKAVHRFFPNHRIVIRVNKTIDNIPLSLIVKTSDGFEIVSSL